MSDDGVCCLFLVAARQPGHFPGRARAQQAQAHVRLHAFGQEAKAAVEEAREKIQANQPDYRVITDPEEIAELMADIRKVQSESQDITIVIVEHVMRVIKMITEHVFVINFGKKIAEVLWTCHYWRYSACFVFDRYP